MRLGVTLTSASTMVVSSPPTGAPRGPMMVSPTRGGLAWLAWPQRLQTRAPTRLRPPQAGAVQVTRSIAVNKEQVASSTVEPAC